MGYDDLSHRWWALTIRGLAGIIFGVITFIAPGISLLALVLLFGAYALVDGIFAIVAAVRSAREGRRWGALVFEGVIGVGAGVLTYLWPGMSALALLLVIASWAVITGVAAIFTAIRLREVIRREWLMIAFGVLSVAFGVLLFLFPGSGALGLVIWIGAYALVSGAVMVGLSLRLRARQKRHEPTIPARHPARA